MACHHPTPVGCPGPFKRFAKKTSDEHKKKINKFSNVCINSRENIEACSVASRPNIFTAPFTMVFNGTECERSGAEWNCCATVMDYRERWLFSPTTISWHCCKYTTHAKAGWDQVTSDFLTDEFDFRRSPLPSR